MRFRKPTAIELLVTAVIITAISWSTYDGYREHQQIEAKVIRDTTQIHR